MTTPLRRLLSLGLLGLLLAACGGSSSGAGSSSSSSGAGSSNSGAGAAATTDVLTYHYDGMRTGQNLTETVLAPSNVNSASFGLLRTLPADGVVDAAPLIVTGLTIGGAVHDVVYVATENDSIYAYDADSGTALLQVSLLASGETPSDPRSCWQVVPQIGITATPVVDRRAGPNGTLYVVAMSKDGAGNYHQRLHALDLLTLVDRMPPVAIQATYPGAGSNAVNGVLSFDPSEYNERGALLLTQGQLLTGWGSHCDINPYNGWIIAYDQASLSQTQVLNLTPNGSRGSIWSVAGLAVDGSGALYGLLANGSFDTTLDSGGLPSGQDYGNAAVRLSLSAASGSLAVTDYFTSWDTVAQSNGDVDLGSGSPLVLPDQIDASGNIRHLLFAAGKDGNIYLLDRDNMGKYNGNNANTDTVYQELDGALAGPGGQGTFSAPAYFGGSIYLAEVGGTLKAFALSQARLPSAPTSHSAATFGYPGTSPSISANGSSNAIVWAIQSSPGSPAVLHAYDPGDLSQEYYNSTQAPNGRDAFGDGNKFITPVVANGKVFVGTPSGVAVFGLLPP